MFSKYILNKYKLCPINKFYSTENIERIFQDILRFNGYEKTIKNIKILKSEKGYVKSQFYVDKSHCNLNKTLYGGCSATLIDCITSLALLSNGKNNGGISMNLNLNYLRAIQMDQNIIIEGIATKVGKNVAYLKGKIYDKDNRLCLTASHIKYMQN
ncbi:hypothetical protein A3Q56_01779 [Intoshia linei]|uniref:Thioesterase domain-containing protein n=1 Tax=Intoshia linei TaxID=1819745 RepID=A0A177BA99_9BILA|nr:hypothetical protein A3Q56_01779 [Intoshia linei]